MPAEPAPIQGVTWRRDWGAGGVASVPGSADPGAASGSAGGALAGAEPAGRCPTISETMATPAPAAATANEIVEMVASEFAELRSDVCCPGRHILALHSSLTVDAFDSDMSPVTLPAMRPTPPTTMPAYVSGPGV